jgi:hypothetical protein
LVLAEVVRKRKIAVIIETFQQSERTIPGERWHRAVAEVIKRNKLAAILQSWHLGVIDTRRWRRAIAEIIKRNKIAALLKSWHSEVIIKRRWRRAIENTVSNDPGFDQKKLDNDGHGTYAAGIILQFAPNAELYVTRVVDTNLTIRRDTLIAERVAKVCEPLYMHANMVLTTM